MEQYITVGNRRNTHNDISDYVMQRINDAFQQLLPVHDYHLRQWALDRADELNISDFKASRTWLHWMKGRANFVGRKVTKFRSRAEIARAGNTSRSKIDFADNYRQVSRLFSPRLILNTDLSGHRYEISNIRSLGHLGSRDHTLRIDNANRNSHSYTIQPIIGRDGIPRGSLLLCFQEQGDEFGPQIERKIRELENELGNVVAMASKSGKLTGLHTRKWIRDVLMPVVVELQDEDQETSSSQSSQATEIADTSWASNPPE